MWKWFNFTFLAVITSLWISGCNQPAVEEEASFPQTLLDPGSSAAIRGSQPGDTPDKVRKRETLDLSKNTDSLLVYVGQLDFNERPVDITLLYSFDEFGLYEFQFDLYPASKSDASNLFGEFRNFLTTLYGVPKKDGLSLRFTSFSPSNNTVEVTLTDETSQAETPFVTLIFLETLDDEI